MNRREVLAGILTAAVTSSARAAGRPARILLRSSWQTVNIGDIAHTPGVLHLLEELLPEADVRLWPMRVDNGVEAMLKRRFPGLVIVPNDAGQTAFADCDFLLHGSGPSLVAARDVAAWRQSTGKPYGVFGITFNSDDERQLELLSDAAFVYFRDSVSLQYAREHGVTSPIMEFGPDGAFATDLRDDVAAETFLAKHRLEPGRFLCCIPRLRHTPYWRIKPGVKFDATKHARNEAMKEHDLAPLRAAILAVVTQTPYKVLVCPEDASQMEVGREMLVDKLPAEARDRVVWRETFWLTGEAVSTYVRSAGLFGAEMHSPIMCIGNGVPAIVCRWQEQTSKGFMWRDIGLGEWLFNFDDEAESARLVPAVLDLARDPQAAKAKAIAARDRVRDRQRQMVNTLKKKLEA